MSWLVTGVTGVVGSEVLAELLRSGERVIAVARSRGRLRAAERLERVLAHHEFRERSGELMARLVVHDLEGARTLDETIRLAGDVEHVVHAAASIRFDAGLDELITENVAPTRALLDTLDRVGNRGAYHQISTAYVRDSSDGSDTVLEAPVDEEETLDERLSGNAYEVSKRMAERVVRERCEGSGRRFTILRPSIVAGAHATGRAAGFNGVAQLLRCLEGLASGGYGPLLVREPVGIACLPQATKNIVPADWLARAVVRIASTASSEGVYHLTNPSPITHAKLLEDVLAHLELDGVSIVERQSRENACSPAQRAVDRLVERFDPYLWGEARFDRRRTRSALGAISDPPPVDRRYLARLLEYGRQVRWASRPLERAIRVTDGLPGLALRAP